MLNFQGTATSNLNGPMTPNMTMSESIDYLLTQTPGWFHDFIKYNILIPFLTLHRSNYSHGVAQSREEVELNEKRMESWINPLEARLPIAPDMRIYCLYDP